MQFILLYTTITAHFASLSPARVVLESTLALLQMTHCSNSQFYFIVHLTAKFYSYLVVALSPGEFLLFTTARQRTRQRVFIRSLHVCSQLIRERSTRIELNTICAISTNVISLLMSFSTQICIRFHIVSILPDF